MNDSTFEKDIFKQPQNWQRCLDHQFGEGKTAMEAAAEQISRARRVVVSGIGASFNAALTLDFLLKNRGISSSAEESSELQHQFFLKKGDLLVLLSRSGKSVELVRLLDLAKAENLPVVSICNDADSPLGRGSDVCLRMNSEFDHSISVSTFTTILVVGLVLEKFLQKNLTEKSATDFQKTVAANFQKIENWLATLPYSPTLLRWIGGDQPESFYYFLARGSSRAASGAAALLWEEAVKIAAVPKTTGGFRHGPQEVISENLSLAIWLDDRSPAAAHDLRLVADLKKLRVNVLKIGGPAADEDSIPMPDLPLGFHLLAEQLPMQIAAHLLAKRRGADPDSFKYCNYVVATEGGIF